MKKLVISFILFCLTAQAQIRTGGGHIDNDNKKDDDIFTITDNGEIGSRPDKITSILLNYTSYLKQKNANCQNLIPKEQFELDFFNLYLKLSVLKLTYISENRCGDFQTYLSCINDNEAQKRFKKVTNNSKTRPYLAKKYNLNEEDIKLLFSFYESLNIICLEQRKNCEVQGF